MNEYVHALFCDDIRQEIGGKVTFVGAYAGFAVIPAYPAVVPKICVAVWTVLPADARPKNIVTRLFLDDSEVLRLPTENIELPDKVGFPSELDLPDGAEVYTLQFPQLAIIGPLNLDGPAAFRVKVDIDGREIRGPSLYFTRQKDAPTDATTKNADPPPK